MKNLCLILLTVFFFCKSTDVVNLLLTEDKVFSICENENCKNEKNEAEKAEKVADDKQVLQPSFQFQQHTGSGKLKAIFSYAEPSESEIFKDLLCPPPEIA